MDSAERVHGGLDARELSALGLAPESVLDLSASVNPYGPCEAVRAALARAPLERYPDREGWHARSVLAAALDVRPERVVLGNGATELLWTLVRVFASERSTVVIAEPTFGELRAAAQALGCRVVGVHGATEQGYMADLDALADVACATGAALVYVCNPTTPIGGAYAGDALAAFAERVPCHVLLDESFLSLSDAHASAALPLPRNVVRVRSLTKDHALAGVRVGYALAAPELIHQIERVRPSWTVSALAQAAVVAAAGESAFVAHSRAQLELDRAALVTDLRALGLAPFASSAPYVAFPVANAAALRACLLLRRHVLVRACASFGLPGVVRVAVRPATERARLITALREEHAE